MRFGNLASDTNESLSAPVKVLLESLAHGLQHDTVNLGNWMRTMEVDLSTRTRILKFYCRTTDIAGAESKVVHGMYKGIPVG